MGAVATSKGGGGGVEGKHKGGRELRVLAWSREAN